MTPAADELVLLYDGLCGFCDRYVRFILARDRGGAMRFAPLQGSYAAAVLRRHSALHGVDSLVLVQTSATRDESVSARSDAVIGVGKYLGGAWGVAASVLRVVPRPIRDFGYDVFARLRYRVFGRFDACPLPSAEERARFML